MKRLAEQFEAEGMRVAYALKNDSLFAQASERKVGLGVLLCGPSKVTISPPPLGLSK